MRINPVILLLVFLMPAVLPAQVNQNRCGTFDAMKNIEQAHPGYMARVNACFDNAKQIAMANKSSRSNADTIYRIQVVFHIVYNNAAENIPDSVVRSQIEVLNEDYRRRNADTIRTRDEFKNIAADAGIEFYLADTDPDGNPTTGITHTQRPSTIYWPPSGLPGGDNVKSFAGGGVDAWPTDRYLNVWVCNILFGLGVLGYSFPPSNAPHWPADTAGLYSDSAKIGVVLHYRGVGRNYSNPLDPSVTKGRSAVHEIGHFLGLRHIWGDGDCSVDDGISDTPDAADASQQSCDTLKNTCPGSPQDFPDMIENFMDYSDDRCLNMFTYGQVGIMRAMLQTSRAGIATMVVDTTADTTVVVPTGLKNGHSDFVNVTVFPNPAKGAVNLNVQVKAGKTYGYAIYNSVGQMITSQSQLNSYSNYHSIDLSGQASGIYFAKISTGEQVLVKKFQLLK